MQTSSSSPIPGVSLIQPHISPSKLYISYPHCYLLYLSAHQSTLSTFSTHSRYLPAHFFLQHVLTLGKILFKQTFFPLCFLELSHSTTPLCLPFSVKIPYQVLCSCALPQPFPIFLSESTRSAIPHSSP